MKKIYIGKDARDKMLVGIKTLADIVTITLGPKGRNVGLDRKYTEPIVVHDGVSVAREVVLEEPCENFGAQLVKQAASKTNDKAGDGPQDLDSKILTPNGWIRMGDVKVGMVISGTNRTTQKVLGVFPKGKKEMFKVSLSGGKQMRCCLDHLFTVKITSRGTKKTLPLKTLIEDYKKQNKDRSKIYKYYIPTTLVEFSNQKEKMPIDPYLLGVLLGDGSLTGTQRSSIEISLGMNKEHILNKLILPKGIEMRSTWVEDKNYFRVKLTGKDESGRSMREIINSLGLLGHTSKTKFIPHQYLYSSIESRKKLLQGLSDTDGHINERELLEYSTVSKQLYVDILELLRGLGKQTHSYLHKRNQNSYSNTSIYRISELKGYKYGDKIINIETTGKTVEMQCIKVSNPDHLYITDDYIPTHNTTTSTLLAYKMVEKGMMEVAKGSNPMILKKGMDLAVEDIVKELEKMSKEIKTSEEIEQVATLSAGNENLGKIIAEAMAKIGKDGVVTVEEGDRMETYVEYKEGMEFEPGYVSQYFATDRLTSKVEKPHIAVCDHVIRTGQEVAEFLTRFTKETGRIEVVFVAPKVEPDALQTMLLNNQKGGLVTLAVYPPAFGKKQVDYIDDIATATGATVISSSKNMSIADATVDMLGKADWVIADEQKTRIIGGYGNKKQINSRVEDLRAKIEEEDSEFEKMKLKERIATLTTGAAIIKTGALTEVELKENKERIIDAVEAVKASRELGINIGGGVPYYQIADSLANRLSKLEGDIMVGYKVVLDSLKEPIAKLLTNAGENLDIIKTLKDKWVENGEIGYNVISQEFGNLYELGVIEPMLVQKQAIINSVSVASIIITTEAVMAYDPKELEVVPTTN